MKKRRQQENMTPQNVNNRILEDLVRDEGNENSVSEIK
jgi:hypothetical protein